VEEEADIKRRGENKNEKFIYYIVASYTWLR